MKKGTSNVLITICLLAQNVTGNEMPKTDSEWREYFKKRVTGSVTVPENNNYKENYDKSLNESKSTIEQIKGYATGKNNINENLAKPVRSGTKMKTVDKSKEFDATLKCNSSKTAISVTFIPAGNNEYRLIIKQDLNLDGAVDYTLDTANLGIRMSGACERGIVFCSPYNSFGDKSKCKFYYFVSDGSGKISLQEDTTASLKNVGSCICTNSSCGINQIVYRPVAGGIIYAFQSSQTKISLDEGTWDQGSFTYFITASNIESCYMEDRNYGSLGVNPETYYKNKTYPNDAMGYVAKTYNPSASENEKMSPYTLALKTQQPKINNKEIKMDSKLSCMINTYAVFENQRWLTDGDTEIDAGVCVSMKKEDNFYSCKVNARGNGCSNNPYGSDLNNFAGSLSIKWNILDDAYVAIKVNNATIYSQGSGKCKGTCGSSGTHSIKIETPSQVSTIFYDDGGCSGKMGSCDDKNECADTFIKIYQTEDIDIKENNTCSNIENNSNCKLMEEVVCDKEGKNCVETIKNYKKKEGPSKFCYTQNSSIRSYLICSNGQNTTVEYEEKGEKKKKEFNKKWQLVKRVYTCENNEDMSLLDRAKNILKGTEISESTQDPSLKYSDPDLGVNSSSVTLKSANQCPVAYCMVRTTIVESNIMSDSSTRGNNKRTPIESRVCNEIDNKWVCPVNQGEVVVDNCNCEDDAEKAGMEAIATINVINEALKDMICSE